MCDNHPTDGAPPSVHLMCDGGREPVRKDTVVRADTVVTREAGGSEQEMLRVPISSTRPDRERDRFAKEALEEMAEQIEVEQPNVFLNHGLAGNYFEAIPYDTDKAKIGALMDAELESAEDGEWDLYALLNPDGTHEFGAKLIPKVRDEGQPEKFSVGFRVKGYEDREEVEEDFEGDGRRFTSADLMETSDVGVPANPDASVTQSVGAKSGMEGLPGYQKHPMMQMLQAMQPGEGRTPGHPDTAAKDAVDSDTVQEATPVHVDGQESKAATDGGEADAKEEKPKCDSDADCSDGQVCEDGHCVDAEEAQADISVAELRALRAELRELREEGDPCDDNGDCGEGYVCVDGECVPEDDVDDDDDDEEDSTMPADTDGQTDRDTDDVPEYVKEMREENRRLREEIAEVRDNLDRGESRTGDTDMTDTPTPDETDSDDNHSDEKSGDNGLLF